MDGAEHVGRILRGVRVSRIFSAAVWIGGSGSVAGRVVLVAAVWSESRIRRRSGDDRNHRVRRDVLHTRAGDEESSTWNDRARVA